ncbi:unnamed protein product [Urochloa decumbens]|uniref:Ubiquitin-like protease family profile domain-containing protein n=1 Tax=Urochloa decumbens TaxID=240449 RepID=A0ABC9G484_9POAL
MGRSLQTSVMHVATYVISQDQKGLRKKIMSPWIGLKLMQPDATKSVMLKKAFNFLNTDYDLILFPIFEPNQADPKAQVHWFTMALNLEAKKFQVIDSMRPSNSPQLIITANKVWAKVVSMWVKVTKNHPGCTVPAIFRHHLDYIDRPPSFTQFGSHDCGLFTLMAIQYWDGKRLPDLIGFDEMKLRKHVLFEIINNSANMINWKSELGMD